MYAYIEGVREAYYWHYRNTSSKIVNHEIHPLFAQQRLIVGFLCVYPLAESMYLKLAFLLCLGLIWSFVHNGAYYSRRNKIDNNIYKKKWFAQSTTSTAKLTKIMTSISRTIMAVVGILGYLTLLLCMIKSI